MDPEIKARWVEALRSGRYEQGQSALNTGGANGQFCCLGVLCELAVEDGVVTRNQPFADSETLRNDPQFYYDNEGGALPKVVREWAGLAYSNPATRVTRGEVYDDLEVPDPQDRMSLAEINDAGKDFTYIAAVIEQEF